MNVQRIVVTFSALAIAMTAQSAFALTTDHKNYWSFDDATGRSVSDVGGQNGVMTGSSTGFGWASGKVGTALAMDGTSGEGIALPDGFLSGGQGSISLWIKMNTLTSQNIIFSGKSTIDNSVYGLLSIDFEGRPQFQYRTQPADSDVKVQGVKILNVNEWYHLVFVTTGQTYKMFINGEELTVNGANTGRWLPEVSNHPFSYRIGRSEASPLSGSWNGMLDEMRIYNRPLTLDEVKELYKQGNEGVSLLPLAVRPAATLSVSSDVVPFGGSVSLNWSTTNVRSCEASGNWNGGVPTAGSQTLLNLGSDASYTLTCTSEYGNVSSTARVLVTPGLTASSTASTAQPGGTLTVTDVTESKVVKHSPFVKNLTIGLRGDEVKRLQLILISQGFLADGLSSGYFGQLTKAAVVKFQAKHGLPTTGYFGPLTRAKIIAVQ